MRKIKAFLYIIFKSLTSVKYYQDLLKTNMSFSMKYFFILTFLASLFVVGVTLIPEIGKMEAKLNEMLDEVKKIYPDDLIITSKEGKLSINKPEPYIVPIPEFPETLSDGEATYTSEVTYPKNLVVFDSNGTIDDLKNYDTWVLVNSANILVQQENKIEAYPLNDVPDGEFNKSHVDEIAVLFQRLIKFMPYFVIFAALIGIMFYYMIMRLVYLLFVGFLLWLAAKVRGIELKYSHFLKIAIHTFTLPLLIELTVNALGVPIYVPFWFFLLNLIFGIIIVASLPKETEVGAESKIEPPTAQ